MCAHSGLTVKVGTGQEKRRHITMIRSVATDLVMGVHNSTIVNLARGVLERVFYINKNGKFVLPPKPLSGVFDQRLSYFKRNIVKRMPPTTPTRREEFPLFYWGRKRTIYENAVASLNRKNVEAKDALVKCFVKAEKINFSAKGDPAPRIISPRDPRYNVAVGCFLKPIEHPIYRSIAQIYGEPTVSKGMSVEEVATLLHSKWNSYSVPVAIGLDASRFDQHISRSALQWEHGIYNSIYNSPDLAKYLSWQLNNTCRGFLRDGKLKYVTDGTRMSGDMNTAMGNCLIMCALVHAYSVKCAVDCKLINNGDDCVVIMHKKSLNQFTNGLEQWFEEMGFTMKVEPPVNVFEKIIFCQMQPVYDGTSYIMVRDPKISIAKDSLSIKPLNSESIFRKWLGAVGEGGVSLTGGIPILQSFYCCFERASRGLRLKDDPTQETGWWHLTRGMARKVSTVKDVTRYSFYLAFGVVPDMQEAIEEYYDSTELLWGQPMFGHPSRPNIWL